VKVNDVPNAEIRLKKKKPFKEPLENFG